MQRRLRTTIELPAGPADVFGLLTTYIRLPEWAPQLGATRVLAREGDIAIIELGKADHGRALVLELIETPPERISFAQVDRFRGEGVNGTCDLRRSTHGTSLELSLRFECSPLALLSPLSELRHAIETAGQGLATTLNVGRREAEGPADAEAAPSPAPVEVLTVSREGGQLRLRLLGRSWTLIEADAERGS